MQRLTRRLGTVVLTLVLSVGAAACGGDEPAAAPQAPEPTVTGTATPTPVPAATPSPSGSATAGAVGLPEGYPDEEVPVLAGVVTGQTGGTGPDGRQGWVLEVSAVGSKQTCFADAKAALVAQGFTEQGRMVAGDTTQAQFTSAEYAVIISVRSDGDELCQVGYEVGQVAS